MLLENYNWEASRLQNLMFDNLSLSLHYVPFNLVDKLKLIGHWCSP